MQSFLRKHAEVFEKTCRAFWLTLVFNFGNMQENRRSVRGTDFGERWAFWEKPCVASGDGLGGSWNRVGWIRCPACFGCIWGGRPAFLGLLRGRIFRGYISSLPGIKTPSAALGMSFLGASGGCRRRQFFCVRAVFLRKVPWLSVYRWLRNSGFPCR